MTTWYRTRWHDSPTFVITPVEIEKSTEASVWVAGMQGRRQARRSEFENFFETREEARAFIRESLNGALEYHLKKVKMFEDALRCLETVK